MLKSINLSFQYSGSTPIRFPDFTAEQGDQWLILGPSGSGKTTLLHLLGGLLSPTEGNVTLGDFNYATISAARLDKFRGENIGIVFQKAHAVQSLSVMENLLLTQQLGGKSLDKKKIMDLLERLQIAHKASSGTFCDSSRNAHMLHRGDFQYCPSTNRYQIQMTILHQSISGNRRLFQPRSQ